MKSITRQWLRKADHDLAAAGHLFEHEPILTDEICFHCQQAIEKCFKSLLAENGLPIQKTHDLMNLLQQLIPLDKTLRMLKRGLKGVSRYAVEFRYPGLNTTLRQARAAFQRAHLVRREIGNRLGEPGA